MLTVEGEQDSVDQAVKIIEEYNHLTRHGRALSAAEVKSLMRVATEEPHESPRGLFEHGRRADADRAIANSRRLDLTENKALKKLLKNEKFPLTKFYFLIS
ncbi:MAG TPA: hypothetical protein VFN26_06475 [Candidatus Acidoferrum sp.]|nr:hypothetical protein [Candidatus Acidoferrum sp.]